MGREHPCEISSSSHLSYGAGMTAPAALVSVHVVVLDPENPKEGMAAVEALQAKACAWNDAQWRDAQGAHEAAQEWTDQARHRERDMADQTRAIRSSAEDLQRQMEVERGAARSASKRKDREVGELKAEMECVWMDVQKETDERKVERHRLCQKLRDKESKLALAERRLHDMRDEIALLQVMRAAREDRVAMERTPQGGGPAGGRLALATSAAEDAAPKDIPQEGTGDRTVGDHHVTEIIPQEATVDKAANDCNGPGFVLLRGIVDGMVHECHVPEIIALAGIFDGTVVNCHVPETISQEDVMDKTFDNYPGTSVGDEAEEFLDAAADEGEGGTRVAAALACTGTDDEDHGTASDPDEDDSEHEFSQAACERWDS